jgi:hypothetical protein
MEVSRLILRKRPVKETIETTTVNGLDRALDLVIATTYGERQYDWNHPTFAALLAAVEKKTSPKLAMLLFSQNPREDSK